MQTFYSTYHFLWRMVECRKMKTERLNKEEILPTVRLKTYSALSLQSCHSMVHTCNANANANANGNASEFRRPTQTQRKRDTEAQSKYFFKMADND